MSGKERKFHQPPQAEQLHEILELHEWSLEGFNVYKKIEALRGPLIEIAGPTEKGYRSLVDIPRLKKRLYISNVSPSVAKYTDRQPVELLGPVDFRTDATNVSLKDKSVGALFCSALGPIGFVGQRDAAADAAAINERNLLREGFIKEAEKVLEANGLLILRDFLKRDVEFALQNGFQLDQLKADYIRDIEERGYDVILEKISLRT